jgi:undecaprenyl-diphosphatase
MPSERDSEPSPGGEQRPEPHATPPGVGFKLDITLGIVLGCLALAGFIWITLLIASANIFPLDAMGLAWAGKNQTPQRLAIALEITALGSTPVVALVLLLAAAFFTTLNRRGDALLLWIATLGGASLNIILKSAFSRPRPPLATAVHAGYFAFPSGHAMSSMVLYATLAYLIVRGLPGTTGELMTTGTATRPGLPEGHGPSNTPGSPYAMANAGAISTPDATTRVLTIIVAVIVILLVGASRVYLGVHYATDVIGGYLIGFAWADLCVLLYESRNARRRWAPP